MKVNKIIKMIFMSLFLSLGATHYAQASQESLHVDLCKKEFLTMKEMTELVNWGFDLSNDSVYQLFLNGLVECFACIEPHLNEEDAMELKTMWAYLSTARSDASRKLMIIKFRGWIEDQLNAQTHR